MSTDEQALVDKQQIVGILYAKKKHVDIKSPADTSIFVDMKIYCRQEKNIVDDQVS